MMKKLKNFCRLTRRSEGFTLVELVVVIAIVAILSGIAVPAYGAYVEKSQKAGDLQLLAAVNKAFAAAAFEHCEGMENIKDAGLQKGSMQKSRAAASTESTAYTIVGMEYVNPLNAEQLDAFNASFQKYYADNLNSEFKAIEKFMFVKGVGFVDPTTNPEGIVSFSYGGGTIYLSEEDAAALAASTFLTAGTLGGSDGLLEQVNKVTGIAAGMAGKLDAVFEDPAFIQCAMDALGVKTEAEYTAKQNAMVEAIKKNTGMEWQDAANQLAANAAVLYAAQNSQKYTSSDLNALFSEKGIDTIKTNLTTPGKTTDGMAQAALVYGMYTAYAHSTGKQELINNTNNASVVLNALNNDKAFKEYVVSDAGQKDLDAYLGALGMISDSATSNPSAVEHLLINGFNNDDLKDIVAEATGK